MISLTQPQCKILINLLQYAEDCEAPHASYDEDSARQYAEMAELRRLLEDESFVAGFVA